MIVWRRKTLIVSNRLTARMSCRKLLFPVDRGGFHFLSSCEYTACSTLQIAGKRQRRLFPVTRESLSSGTEPFGSRLISTLEQKEGVFCALFIPAHALSNVLFPLYLWSFSSIIAKMRINFEQVHFHLLLEFDDRFVRL